LEFGILEFLNFGIFRLQLPADVDEILVGGTFFKELLFLMHWSMAGASLPNPDTWKHDGPE
jgi:hypothetical protein